MVPLVSPLLFANRNGESSLGSGGSGDQGLGKGLAVAATEAVEVTHLRSAASAVLPAALPAELPVAMPPCWFDELCADVIDGCDDGEATSPNKGDDGDIEGPNVLHVALDSSCLLQNEVPIADDVATVVNAGLPGALPPWLEDFWFGDESGSGGGGGDIGNGRGGGGSHDDDITQLLSLDHEPAVTAEPGGTLEPALRGPCGVADESGDHSSPPPLLLTLRLSPGSGMTAAGVVAEQARIGLVGGRGRGLSGRENCGWYSHGGGVGQHGQRMQRSESSDVSMASAELDRWTTLERQVGAHEACWYSHRSLAHLSPIDFSRLCYLFFTRVRRGPCYKERALLEPLLADDPGSDPVLLAGLGCDSSIVLSRSGSDNDFDGYGGHDGGENDVKGNGEGAKRNHTGSGDWDEPPRQAPATEAGYTDSHGMFRAGGPGELSGGRSGGGRGCESSSGGRGRGIGFKSGGSDGSQWDGPPPPRPQHRGSGGGRDPPLSTGGTNRTGRLDVASLVAEVAVVR